MSRSLLEDVKAKLADNVEGYASINFKDAGNRSRDHYKTSMSPRRFRLRQALLPLVRWETAHLAKLQLKWRSKFWDEYFAFSANLGAHTFFVIMLPMPFWFGYAQLARTLVYVLAAGVIFSGMLKDYFCLPRPLSPPLHRITMSGSAALEYGCPSTHSANAVAAALAIVYYALDRKDEIAPSSLLIIKVLMWIYIASILLGRLYCGMHGFMDVISGSAIGLVVFLIRWAFKEQIDSFMITPGPIVPLVITPIILILVRVHPEPVDPCPCFEDSVAFSGVVLGVDLALWHSWNMPWTTTLPYPGYIPYSFAHSGIFRSAVRVVLGVTCIFLWRAIMKKSLHALLPPLFRFIERIGLSMPRVFFLQASEYNKVPGSIPDTTLVNAREIPSLIGNITRGRSDSVGPQSTADMYETMAYREERQRRRSLEGQGSNAASAPPSKGLNTLLNDCIIIVRLTFFLSSRGA